MYMYTCFKQFELKLKKKKKKTNGDRQSHIIIGKKGKKKTKKQKNFKCYETLMSIKSEKNPHRRKKKPPLIFTEIEKLRNLKIDKKK